MGDAQRAVETFDGRSIPNRETQRIRRLLSAVGDGNEAAFARLYDELVTTVHAVVLTIVGRDVPTAERVTKDVFVEIWRDAARYDGSSGTPRAWSCAIAQRRANDEVHGVTGPAGVVG